MNNDYSASATSSGSGSGSGDGQRKGDVATAPPSLPAPAIANGTATTTTGGGMDKKSNSNSNGSEGGVQDASSTEVMKAALDSVMEDQHSNLQSILDAFPRFSLLSYHRLSMLYVPLPVSPLLGVNFTPSSGLILTPR